MWQTRVFSCAVVLFGIGISKYANGAAIDETFTNSSTRVSLQDLKEYIHPILFKRLQTPGDTPVITDAKNVVSEFLTNSLVDSIQSPPEEEDKAVGARPSGKQNNNANQAVSSVGSALGNLVRPSRPRPSQQHVLSQVDLLLQNVNGANITGIVDNALLIRAPAPVRTLVNSILNQVLCNPINRLWNRCAGGGSLIFDNNQNAVAAAAAPPNTIPNNNNNNNNVNAQRTH